MRVLSGDLITFLQSGKAKFKPDGKKAETMDVGEGEAVMIKHDGDITGIKATRTPRRLDRMAEKFAPRAQTLRVPGEKMVVLEVPDAILTEAQRIEMIHEERGRQLRNRLALETGRLRQ